MLWQSGLMLISLSARGSLLTLAAVAAMAAVAFVPRAVAAALPAILPTEPVEGAELQFFVENDFLAGTDRYYSNGLKLGGGIPCARLQVPAQASLERLIDAGDATHLGLFVGQNLYTPPNIKISGPQLGDRPWAAWAYVGGVAQQTRGDRLHTVELDVGVVGPVALGEAVQTGWHKLIGAPRPRGWDNQIRNELAFQLAYLGKQRYDFGVMDFIPHAGVTVGTVTTLARLGGLVRIGQNMGGFGPDTIEPGGALLQNMRRANERLRTDGEWYVFAGVDHRWVAHSIFLDGSLLRSNGRAAETVASIDRRAHVYDLTAGVSVRWQALRVSLTRVRRSPEFSASGSGESGGRQTFDSINVGVEF